MSSKYRRISDIPVNGLPRKGARAGSPYSMAETSCAVEKYERRVSTSCFSEKELQKVCADRRSSSLEGIVDQYSNKHEMTKTE